MKINSKKKKKLNFMTKPDLKKHSDFIKLFYDYLDHNFVS